MPRTVTSLHQSSKQLLKSACTLSFVIMASGMSLTAPASELRPYILPSQNMEQRGQYQQRQVITERVEENFYKDFARDSKKYDAKRKTSTKAYLQDKLNKSTTDAEVTHYTRLLNILKGR
ncbi:MAG: hypothetical protein ACOYL3_10605 [Desulfuromonadaceae bacterium]